MKKPKIFIALPTKRYIEPETEDCLAEKIFRPNDTYEVGDYVKLRNSPNIYAQRYNLARRFLESDCSHYFYFDSDQVIIEPTDAVEILIKDDLDIVSPLITRTVFPFLPACMSFEQKKQFDRRNSKFFEDYRRFPQDRPFEVYYSCGGIVMIRRAVIEQVRKPFYPVYNESGELLSVDYALYYQAKKRGFKCYIEPRVKAGHIGSFIYMIDDYYQLLDSGLLEKGTDGLASVFSLKEKLK